MSQNKTWVRLFCIVFFQLCLSLFSYSQHLILRPGIGYWYISTKPNSEPNKFEASFTGEFKFRKPAASISAELMYPRHSYELVFNSLHVGAGMSTTHAIANMEAGTLSNTGIRQFQFLYNKFLPVKGLSSFTPIVSLGLGWGINRPNSIYADTSFGVFQVTHPLYPGEVLDIDVRHAAVSRFSYSTVFKIGFVYKAKKVERFRLQAVYNLGLNTLSRTTIKYAHTNAKYYGFSTSKGSQFSIIASVPIYLRRKK